MQKDTGPVQQLEPLVSFPSPGKHLCGLAWDGESLWYSDGDAQRIFQINLETKAVVRSIPCWDVRTGLAYDGQYLWQVAGRPKQLRCLDPLDGSVLRRIPLETEDATGIDVGDGDFWLGLRVQGLLQLRSLDEGDVLLEFETEPDIAGLCRVNGLVWYCEYTQGLLIAFDSQRGVEKARYRVQGNPTGLTFNGNSFWYNNYRDKTISAVRVED
jgi:glutamine cyclotransferase